MDKNLNNIGKGAYASIVEMVSALDGDNRSQYEDAVEAIQQDPLSVEVRDGWRNPFDAPEDSPEEYRILLGTGGPAIRIVGELDGHCQPSTARLQVQDWGTPWTDYKDADESILLAYASVFYFGE